MCSIRNCIWLHRMPDRTWLLQKKLKLCLALTGNILNFLKKHKNALNEIDFAMDVDLVKELERQHSMTWFDGELTDDTYDFSGHHEYAESCSSVSTIEDTTHTEEVSLNNTDSLENTCIHNTPTSTHSDLNNPSTTLDQDNLRKEHESPPSPKRTKFV